MSILKNSTSSSNNEISKENTQFVFNETGNIMMVWTGEDSDSCPPEIKKQFSKVADFFVSMVSSISSTINPATGKVYSIYNYEAIQKFINNSGAFDLVTSEDIQYRTQSYGTTFCVELVGKVLSIPTKIDTFPFAKAMISTMGNVGLRIGESTSSTHAKVGNIIFVCEYLLGAVMVSPVVVSCDVRLNKQLFQIGPCNKESSTSTSLSFHKDVYMFNLKNNIDY